MPSSLSSSGRSRRDAGTPVVAEGRRLLLHACCAPDASVPWLDLRAEGYEVLPYWYGANIHPSDEEARRREALSLLAARMGGRIVIDSCEASCWLEETSHLADEPEGGRRCALCFRLQLEGAARAALREGAGVLCTTLTISPHKDADLINRIGAECAAGHGLEWLVRVFRKRDGFLRSVALSREYGLYRQGYCGCVYSMAGGAGRWV